MYIVTYKDATPQTYILILFRILCVYPTSARLWYQIVIITQKSWNLCMVFSSSKFIFFEIIPIICWCYSFLLFAQMIFLKLKISLIYDHEKNIRNYGKIVLLAVEFIANWGREVLFSLNTIIQLRHNIVATLAITTKDGGFSNKERRLVWMGVDNAPFPRYSKFL